MLLHVNWQRLAFTRDVRSRGQNFRPQLVLVASGLGLMQCWPRSHEVCPRGLVVSRRNHAIYVTLFSGTLLDKLEFLKCNDC